MSGDPAVKGGPPYGGGGGGVGSEMHNVSYENALCELRPNYRARAGRREKFFGTVNAIRYCQRAFPTEIRLKFLKFSRLRRVIF